MQRPLIPALLSLLLAACAGGEGGAPPSMPPTPVSVATVIERPVTDWSSWNGRIQAVQQAEIRARVAGELRAVHFREGDAVAAGVLLFTLDDREYRAALANARANRSRAEARLDLARRELKRARALQEAGVMSGEELDARIGEERQAEADLAAARAALAQAELNLEFTRISAPFAGRISAAEVQPGNLIQPGVTLLTTLVSVDPVRVDFQIDEPAYLRLKRSLAGAAESAPPVRVTLSGDTAPSHEGRVVFVDNALDPGTGTLRVRAELPNPDGLLTPGLFARVELRGDSTAAALLIHDQAVLTDQDRRYVWVAGSGELAERRDVRLGSQSEGLRVIESGLQPGDRVVVNGVRKIFMPGQSLEPTEVPMTEPNQAPVAAGGQG